MGASNTTSVTIQKSGYAAYKLYMSIVENSNDSEANTSNVTVKMWAQGQSSSASAYNSSTSNYAYITVDGSRKTTKYMAMDFRNQAVVNLYEWTGNVSHDNDGKKTLECSGYFKIVGASSLTDGTITCSVVLTVNARGATISLSNLNLYPNASTTITLSNTTAGMTYRLQYSFVSAGWTTFKNITESPYSYTWIVPQDFANLVTNKTTSWGQVKCITLNSSGTQIGENTVRFEFSIPDTAAYYPTISNVSIEEGNSEVSELVGNRYVQAKSALRIKTTADGVFGSTISSIKHKIGTATYVASADWTSGIINLSGSVPVVTSVTDSRQRTKTYTSYVTILPYHEPQITVFDGFRADSAGEPDNASMKAKISYAFSISELDGYNANVYTIDRLQNGEETYNTIESGDGYEKDTSVITGELFNSSYSYTVRLTVTDSFASASATFSISTAGRLVSYIAKKSALAVGKVAETANLFDIDLDTKFSRNLSIGDTNVNELLAKLVYTSSKTYTTDYGLTVTASRYGGVVTLAISGSPTSLTSTATWTALATVDAEYRPAFELPYETKVSQGDGTQVFLLTVNKTSGAVRINPTVSALNRYINCYICYPAAL